MDRYFEIELKLNTSVQSLKTKRSCVSNMLGSFRDWSNLQFSSKPAVAAASDDDVGLVLLANFSKWSEHWVNWTQPLNSRILREIENLSFLTSSYKWYLDIDIVKYFIKTFRYCSLNNSNIISVDLLFLFIFQNWEHHSNFIKFSVTTIPFFSPKLFTN